MKACEDVKNKEVDTLVMLQALLDKGRKLVLPTRPVELARLETNVMPLTNLLNFRRLEL